ncbi:MAG: hypothetical protein NXH85_03025 [Pseudomonadaceae bacterium]|nr:hypothetical protein [Pseudomonadaceae bacterium]
MVAHVANNLPVKTEGDEHGQANERADDKRRPEMRDIRRPFTKAQGNGQPQCGWQRNAVENERQRLFLAPGKLLEVLTDDGDASLLYSNSQKPVVRRGQEQQGEMP